MAAEFTSADDDTTWVGSLDRMGHPGRQLNEHLRCVDFCIQNKNRAECPVQQVTTFRRVFCRAFSENTRCFGLPRLTPKFIAIVNLSGYRAILYSNRTSLIRLLCLCGPEASQRVMTNVEAVMRYSIDHNCSVLCCLSLPWQAGVHQTHWEVRTLERRPDGGVRDGQRCYSYTHDEVRTVAPTGESDIGDPAQMAAQMDAMAKHFAAANMDVCLDVDSCEAGSSDDSEKLQKMRNIVAAVQTDRARILGELDAIREDHAEKLKGAYIMADERVGKVTEKAQIAVKVADTKVMELSRQVAELKETNAGLEKRNATLTREKAAQDLEFGSERVQLTSKANVHEMNAKSALETARRTKRDREQLEKAHAKETEELRGRLQEKTIDVQKLQHALNNSSSTMKRLDAVIEQMRTENQALAYDALLRRRKSAGFQCALAVACEKHRRFKEAVEKEHTAMAAGQHNLQQMVFQAETASCAAELQNELITSETSKDIARLKRELADERKKKTLPPLLPPPIETRAAACNTEPQQDPAELTDLRIEVAGLITEKAAWAEKEHGLQAQVDELRTQLGNTHIHPMNASSSPTGSSLVKQVYNQVYTHVVVPGNGASGANGANGAWPQQGPIDLAVDPAGDPGVEALVGQLQHGMRALVDMARQGYGHKHAADSMWSELQTMKRIGQEASWQQHAYYDQGQMVPMPGMMWAPAPHVQPPPYTNGNGAPRGSRRGGK